ncbi:MAG: DUF4301 family protein [Candidatus Aminicenantes bacterium]|nr:DUF4301 family protein [Candidatus Aminicenantes bacterium]NIM80205.1 DUF4301 family protein [Candidatus Aminicenantes bacterium]NIN19544.1 DUF4301 family protein [Candidatus Aminicenantes bacterium]NIN43438.1 DUF4301 family protein [Candidatus Aminicenantes bacterium]NIN86183.1 DUF4301 family protein [Candidatus Aminicenantes bacterium]
MSKIELSAKDEKQLAAKGISEDQLLSQLEKFMKGSALVNLVRAATISDGIVRLSGNEKKELIELFEKESKTCKRIKFVPASGAASRMFKTLLAFYNNPAETVKREVIEKAEKGDPDYIFLRDFIEGLKNRKFAFYNELKKSVERDGLNLEGLLEGGNYKLLLEYVLTPKGLNYNDLPKGMIKFHRCDDYVRNPFEEHMVEGMAYSGNNNEVNIHFTIPPQSEKAIKDYIDSVRQRYEKDGIRFNITFSEQKPSTDTLAVDDENNLFRDSKGELVFRPGGHGALIENLNELREDIIFIKNIDNVVHERLIEQTIQYKKVLAGYLLKARSLVFNSLETLSKEEVKEDEIDKIAEYAGNNLNIFIPGVFSDWVLQKKKEWLFKKLNRPIRVCGMVINKGEPGGGPYWVEKDENISLQIIEEGQIDKKSRSQLKIMKDSTHFNPVDLVCGVKDYKGNKFNLIDFIAHDTYFISEKSMEGRPLKALELPGLWNGAMYDWITLFVEVPIITFNPVKTVNDLLREEHQMI